MQEHVQLAPTSPQVADAARQPSATLHQFGRYTITGLLGSGGMGAVYSAYDAELARKIAIKIIRLAGHDPNEAAARTEELQSRFLREARALAKLTHPNIVAIYDVGMAQGNMYYAMEEIVGQSLSQWLESRPPASLRHRWLAIVELMLQAGEGLLAAHRAGLVHRDFKPANVLIDRQGRALVADFGLVASGFAGQHSTGAASHGDAGPSRSSASHSEWSIAGTVVGTPQFHGARTARRCAGRPSLGSFQLLRHLVFCALRRVALCRNNPRRSRLRQFARLDFTADPNATQTGTEVVVRLDRARTFAGCR